MSKNKWEAIKANPKEIVDAMMKKVRPSPYFDIDSLESDHEYEAPEWAYEEFEDQINDFIIGRYTDGVPAPRLKTRGLC